MPMKKHRVALLIGGFMAAAAAFPATATTLLEMSFEDLVAESAVVVLGEAADQRVEQTTSGVVTVTTFNVEDAIVGDAGATVEVVTPGGVYKPGAVLVREWTADTPLFLRGSEAMLFLAPQDGAYGVVGYNQGAVRVFNTARGKSVRLPGAKGAETVGEAAGRVRAEKAHPSGRGGKKTD